MENPPENHLKTCDFRAVLNWYNDMGVDASIGEQPVNWFESGKSIDQSLIARARKKAKPKRSQSPAAAFLKDNSTSSNNQKPHNPAAAFANAASAGLKTGQPTPSMAKTAPLALPSLERARELAKAAKTLDDVKTALRDFDGCSLKRTAKNLVFSRGNPAADLMIIGEAPGRDEDIVGKPFVGRAGQLLDRMLKAINLSENEAYITNIVYWRPPGNRTPTDEEGMICRPFLNRQIELVGPKVILFLGGAAAKQVYETPTGITKLRGKWKEIEVNAKTYETMATLHPAYLLRTPIAKRLAWQDLQKIQQKLSS